MNNRSNFELEQIKKFVVNYGIRDITIETAQRHKASAMDSYGMYYQNHDYVSFDIERFNMYKMSVPEQSLDKIVNIVNEFEELMRDPETAKLLMEARFINRLKYGSKI